MKHLKKYMAFESKSRGHEHSWEDIEDVMLYLKDIGFEYKEDSKRKKFVDSDNHKCNLEDAENLCTEFQMFKKVPENMKSNVSSDLHTKPFLKWDDKILEIYEALASFCAHFDDCRYSITVEFGEWVLSIIIITPVPHDDKSAEREDKINNQVIEELGNYFNRFRNKILNEFTSKTSSALTKNKLGEGMWGLQGSTKDGFVICAFNIDNVRNKKSALVNIDGYSEGLRNTTDGKVEFRDINEADIAKLAKLKHNSGATLDYFNDRYLGLKAYIIEFDYNKFYKKRREFLFGEGN